MVEMQEKNSSKAAAPFRQDREMPLDTMLLSEAVIELNISRKNVGIYPPGHVQITRSIDRAYEILQRMFEVAPEMTLGVAKDTLLVGRDYLDRKNPVYRDFALSMNQQGIAAVTFKRGLDRDELVKFHRILTSRPEVIREAGGISKVMADAAIAHIAIKAIDYADFHLTEEQEIRRQPGAAEKAGAEVWQDFVSQLVSGSLAAAGEGLSLSEVMHIDISELAKLLNERKLDSNIAVQSYERIISEHVRAAAEKKQPTREQSLTLANLNALIRELHPEIRRQFLSTAFQHIASQGGRAEELMGGFPDDMVIEMIRKASEDGREISPTLTGLVQKLSAVHGASREKPIPEREQQAPDLSAEKMQKLFDRETYEQYVSEDYDATLRRVSEGAAVAGKAGIEGFHVEDHEKTLQDDQLDFGIGRALLAFMEEEIEYEDYVEFSKKVIAVVPELLESGNFALLLDMLETLRRHGREKPSQLVRETAGESLKVFSEPEFIARAVSAFDGWARTKGREAAGLLLALGPASVPGLLDLYANDESPGGRRMLFDLLCNFGQAAVSEALRRLKDPRPYYVRNLLMLIRWAGNKDAVPHIKPLLLHPDHKVKLEAVAALLRFKSSEAVSLLREALNSKDPDVSSQAVFLAGQYRVGDVVEDLLSMIRKVIFFDADYTVNQEIIKALGETGDPRAIPELEKLAKASWTLYPESLSRMKLALFESLGRYPKDGLGGLLKIGEKSGDEMIKKICRRLMENK